MAKVLSVALGCVLLLQLTSAAITVSRGDIHSLDDPTAAVAKKHKKAFTTPDACKGLFIQERASKQLPGPGQHFRFGALKEWEDVHAAMPADSKLLLLVRHGQAVSNYLSDKLGPDIWYTAEEQCNYKDNGTDYEIFDAALTNLGMDEAKALNLMLNGGGWFKRLTAGKSARVIVSPLTRCLQTTGLVLDQLAPGISAINVEEDVRETLGEDTCDARRGASDPRVEGHGPKEPEGPCPYTKGLRTKFPEYQFPVRSECGHSEGLCANSGFGLTSDTDTLWTKTRESQNHQVKRATRFLTTLFEHAPEQVIVVVTHSGFARSVLLAAGREPYRPQNTELVPLIIVKTPCSPPSALRTGSTAALEDAVLERGWSDAE